MANKTIITVTIDVDLLQKLNELNLNKSKTVNEALRSYLLDYQDLDILKAEENLLLKKLKKIQDSIEYVKQLQKKREERKQNLREKYRKEIEKTQQMFSSVKYMLDTGKRPSGKPIQPEQKKHLLKRKEELEKQLKELEKQLKSLNQSKVL